MKKKEVLVLFKTHLDVGFTDYSKNIINNYLNVFIPNAIRVGYELRGSNTPFIWTVGSWMIWKALKEDKTGTVEQAVRDGILNWHGLPFTTHTELLTPELFEFGLNISAELDKKFGRKTIGAKMTDVPGHTKGMISLMQKKGLEFLHIGVNTVTPMPPVPPLFRWKNGKDNIIVMYEHGYGFTTEFDDFVVCFAHTNDNMGPQSKEEIISIYNDIQRKYPNHSIKAATLNDVAERIKNIKDIPIFEGEIGDTWIHGAATDPQKLSRYRQLLRYTKANNIHDEKLYENLLLIPEHTWGMDIKLYFKDSIHYTYAQMSECTKERETIEKSWEEQRDYVRKAENILGIATSYNTEKPQLSQFIKSQTVQPPNIEISWQIFDNADYDRYKKCYMQITEKNRDWGSWDYTKVGLPDYVGGIYTAKATEGYEKGNVKVYKLEFDKNDAEKYGLPYFYLTVNGSNNIEIKWFGKKISRLPQACWMKFRGFDEKWELNKMGEWIKPDDIVGSPLISAIENGIRNSNYQINSLDAALVAPYGRKLLHYNEHDLKQDLYFNLYNNIWNTNFPLWYSDDALFRFEVTKLK